MLELYGVGGAGTGFGYSVTYSIDGGGTMTETDNHLISGGGGNGQGAQFRGTGGSDLHATGNAAAGTSWVGGSSGGYYAWSKYAGWSPVSYTANAVFGGGLVVMVVRKYGRCWCNYCERCRWIWWRNTIPPYPPPWVYVSFWPINRA